MELRPYQRDAIDRLFKEILADPSKNPCVVAPMGAGKSVIIASFMKEVLERWGDTHILLLTHQKELIEQDVDKLKRLAPDLDIGIYSASLGEKDLAHQITFASIQSIYKEEQKFDVILVDECHLINNKEEGRYQEYFKKQNAMVIGFTGTPFRMGQGKLVEDGNLFDYYVKTVGILELQKMGYLSKLTTKMTDTEINTDGIGVVAGEFNQGELEEKVNRYETNQQIAEEIVRKVGYYERQHVIIFCSSVSHSENICDLLNAMDFPCVSVDGKLSLKEREERLRKFTSGEVRAITNCAILTTGFDYPDVDCVVLIRPTLSTGLYLQMVGRGIRIAEGKKDCLLLDFGGNVMRHGPIGRPRDVRKNATGRGKGTGLPLVRVCPKCLEVMDSSEYVCPSCGYEFPVKSALEITTRKLFYGDANGDGEEMPEGDYVESWNWRLGQSRAGMEMWTITYFCQGSKTVKEYLNTDPRYSDYVQKKTRDRLKDFCSHFGITYGDYKFRNGELDIRGLVQAIKSELPPILVFTEKNKSGYDEVVGIISRREFSIRGELESNTQDEINEKRREVWESSRKYLRK